MADRDHDVVSEPLRQALGDFRVFLRSDDLERTEAIESADGEALSSLASAVEPLFDEVDQVLRALDARPRPLPEHLEQLEEDLNSLAQAAVEARLELGAREVR